MDVLDYKGLKSETIDNNKLEVSWTMKPPTTRAMRGGRQEVCQKNIPNIMSSVSPVTIHVQILV